MSIDGVSLKQALVLWSELEAAFYGENGFGGDTAEIYLSTLQPRSAIADAGERGDAGKMGQAVAFDRHVESNHALVWFLLRFQAQHEGGVIRPGIKAILINDVPLELFDAATSRAYRVHVKIVKDRKRG